MWRSGVAHYLYFSPSYFSGMMNRSICAHSQSWDNDKCRRELKADSSGALMKHYIIWLGGCGVRKKDKKKTPQETVRFATRVTRLCLSRKYCSSNVISFFLSFSLFRFLDSAFYPVSNYACRKNPWRYLLTCLMKIDEWIKYIGLDMWQSIVSSRHWATECS